LFTFRKTPSGNTHSNSGSLLLEVAVALSIIGIIAGFLVTKTLTANRALRAQMTHNNIETVVAAMASFLANNNRLPLPSVDASGLERNASTSNLSDYAGRVPFAVLGLSEKDTIDGKGRPLVYVVEPFLTQQFSDIYKNNIEGGGTIGRQDYFCNDVYDPKIIIDQQTLPISTTVATANVDIIAFALDTEDAKPAIVGNKFVIKKTANVKWITRDLLLVKYMKNCPCRRRAPQNTSSSALSEGTEEEDDIFSTQDSFHASGSGGEAETYDGVYD
jgi:type II secretory pathway pseudopilin PulG